MKQKGFSKILILLGLLVAGSLFGAYYLSTLRNKPQPPSISPQAALERHRAFHYPHPQDLTEEVKPIPFLTLPFKKADLEKNPLNKSELYDISQGWIYSQQELDIHDGNPIHGGVDIHVPYGSQVISPVDGFAMSSYQTQWVREGADYQEAAKDNEEYKKPIRKYQGKEIRLGLGYFVYIYVPSVNRFLELAHLSDIDSSIPFSPPTHNPKTDSWDPENYKTSIDDMPKSPNWVAVKKGDPLGKVGYSGLTWGYDEYVEGTKRPVILDPGKFKSWDIAHLHLEEFYFNQQTKQKGWQRDPYAIYDTYDHYPTETRKGLMGKDPLWILDKDNLPQFTK